MHFQVVGGIRLNPKVITSLLVIALALSSAPSYASRHGSRGVAPTGSGGSGGGGGGGGQMPDGKMYDEAQEKANKKQEEILKRGEEAIDKQKEANDKKAEEITQAMKSLEEQRDGDKYTKQFEAMNTQVAATFKPGADSTEAFDQLRAVTAAGTQAITASMNTLVGVLDRAIEIRKGQGGAAGPTIEQQFANNTRGGGGVGARVSDPLGLTFQNSSRAFDNSTRAFGNPTGAPENSSRAFGNSPSPRSLTYNPPR